MPTAGQLDALGSRALDRLDWLAVGYGTQESQREPGGHVHPGGGVRMKAPVDFDALNKSWVRLAMNESRDLGGACYGDSGGPNFMELKSQLVLVATTITGDIPCYATNVSYRLDTVSARTFLDPTSTCRSGHLPLAIAGEPLVRVSDAGLGRSVRSSVIGACHRPV